MYTLETRAKFDSAHFLKDYEGRCANIHGHRWEVVVEVKSETVQKTGPFRGMVVDFAVLKKDLREETKRLDHALIIEKGSLKEKTMDALKEEGFSIIILPFRPTAENLAKHFFDYMTKKGYDVASASVYETPNNKATYTE